MIILIRTKNFMLLIDKIWCIKFIKYNCMYQGIGFRLWLGPIYMHYLKTKYN